MKHAIYKNALKGVSTLDIMKKSINFLIFLVILSAFSANVFSRSGHSTLDLVDPSFNPQIMTNFYGGKIVQRIETLPNGKILVFGKFNSYNGIPTGQLVRLNADGSLDTSFNNKTVTSSGFCSPRDNIIVQTDGKIVLSCSDMVTIGKAPKNLIRLNADGTLDASFNYTFTTEIIACASDSLNRLAVHGLFQLPTGTRYIVRLNPDGSYDSSFNYTNSFTTTFMTTQGSRVIVGDNRIIRLNENGSEDTSFTSFPVGNGGVKRLITQPDNKILYVTSVISRLNENGTSDSTFQTTTLSVFGEPTMRRAADGKIIVTEMSSRATFRRYPANGGGEDTSFTPYYHPVFTGAFNAQPDGSVIIGDSYNDGSPYGLNNFIRLTSAGVPDPTFNPGGIGFQNILPGSIRAIEPLPNGKVFLGGKFDLINDTSRPKIARVNADGTVDTAFQINTSGSGNYFSVVSDVYNIRAQTDGKVIVSGIFDYVQNGVSRKNLVRLNLDGSIDTTFNFTETIIDWSVSNGAGKSPLLSFSDGKSMVGISRANGFGPVGPLKFNENGSRDSTFNSGISAQFPIVYIDDLELQPDGKILVSGTRSAPDGGTLVSFVVRLATDGSLDTTFSYPEEMGRLKPVIALFPNGKILVAKHSNGNSFGRVQRLNADGSTDASFNSLSIPNGIINALMILPNGKIFVGGKFTLTVNGQERKNLLQLSADGNFEPTSYNVNEEVLCLAADGEGRVLVGGGFTVIGANGDNAARSYVARLTDSTARFDFDGDGRSDLSAFTSANGKWTIRNSGSNQTSEMVFGLNGDKLAAADYDGDNKADIAVFRPSNGVWYLWRSRDGFTALQWGLAEDKPVAADYDGDGLADIATWRPSSGVWYVRQSSNAQLFAVQFGMKGDIPLTDADFDGDGKADIAVWRPSNGVFYWLASGSNLQFRAVQFGLSGDLPVVGDFNGDGKTDLVVFRPADGIWYQLLTQPNGNYSYSGYTFGMNGDEPVAADYDGDGKTDIAVRRGNVWHINRTSQGYIPVLFAEANDLAVPSSLIR